MQTILIIIKTFVFYIYLYEKISLFEKNFSILCFIDSKVSTLGQE